MSVNAESSDGVDDEEKWFFTWLLEVQAETMLNKGSSGGQTHTSRFPVSNLPSLKDYRISIRRGIERAGNTTNNVEHIMITYNEEDQSYGIEGQKRYQSVVEVVRNYIASHDEGNHTVTDTSSNIRSNESTRTEEPPAYTQHPTDNQPLPQIKTKLDINKVEEGKPKDSFQKNSSTFYGRERGCCCGACNSGYNWYSFSGAGWLRRICLIVLYSIGIFFCGICLLTGIIIVFLSLKLCSTEVGCCDKCGSWCGCEDFCEEHFVCCDDD